MSKYFLVLDSREHKLIKLFSNIDIDNFKIITKNLKIGDIQILRDLEHNNEELSFDKKNTILIIERKTTQDLLASISDTRYREQKSRLLSNFNLNQISYLIENQIDDSLNKYRKNGKKIVIGAILNKIFRDDIRVIRTDNLTETVTFLVTICKKINTNPEFFTKNNNQYDTECDTSNPGNLSDYGNTAYSGNLSDYGNTAYSDNPSNPSNPGNSCDTGNPGNSCDTGNPGNSCDTSNTNDSNNTLTKSYIENVKVSVSKKDNITPLTFNLLALTIIPGVSHKISLVILNKYKSINNMILLIKTDTNFEVNLSNIELSTKTDKKRKLGKVLANRIVSFLRE